MKRLVLKDDLSHPVLAEFYAYWLSLGACDRLPTRQDIDPQAIKKLLPNLFMIDISGTAPDYRFTYRLAGTEIVRTYGIEFTGLTPEEAFPGRAEELIAHYRDVVNIGKPAYYAYQAPIPGREYLDVERLICPLGTGGDKVEILIGVLGFRN